VPTLCFLKQTAKAESASATATASTHARSRAELKAGVFPPSAERRASPRCPIPSTPTSPSTRQGVAQA